VRGVTNDLFISYAHADNEAGTGRDHWVTRFVGDLGLALKRRLGKSNDLQLYFDFSKLEGHEHIKVLLQHAAASALFVSVLSPSSVQRQWTMDELAAFAQAKGTQNRIFLIETLPLDREEDYPELVRGLKRTEFWQRMKDRDVPITLNPLLESEHAARYLNRI